MLSNRRLAIVLLALFESNFLSEAMTFDVIDKAYACEYEAS